ncbi:hypothetical protein ABZ721_39890 [Streptomyces sp. NPDC006733]|uniref:hypothetical protein n=1 Tax=Streptomyces sp. NPDC006733 TaxID=3155460 RepID=UPI0033CFF623
MSKKQPGKPSPDEGLAVEQFPTMNQSFYAGDPADYFRRRFHLLMLAAGKTDEINQLLADGFTFEDIRVDVPVSEPTDDAERAHAGFITTEAETLLHHASEALLRLFFAHAELPPCPWLECARMRLPAAFMNRVRDLCEKPIPKEQIGRVFLAKVPDGDDPAWSQQVHDLERFLRFVARRVLDDKTLYNAAKHGLAVLAGPSSVSITNDQSGASFGASGQSMSFLEVHAADDNVKTWRLTTRWLSAKDSMWLTGLVITEMNTLWALARAYYSDVVPDRFEVLTTETVDALMRLGTGSGNAFTRSSFSLTYCQSPPQADAAGQTTTTGA